jgi:hypothetical protein
MARRVTTAPGELEALRQARAWLTQAGPGASGRSLRRMMVVTKSFRDLVRNRAARDADFAAALVRAASDAILAGDAKTGEVVLNWASLPNIDGDAGERGGAV